MEQPDAEFGDDFQSALIELGGFGGAMGKAVAFAQQAEPRFNLFTVDFARQSGLGVTQLQLGVDFQVGAITDADGDGDSDLYAAGPATDTGALSGQFYTNDPNDAADQFTTSGASELSGLPNGIRFTGLSFSDLDLDGSNNEGVYTTRRTDTTSIPGFGVLRYQAGSVTIESFYEFPDAESFVNIVDFVTIYGPEAAGFGGAAVEGTGSARDIALSLEWADEVRVLPNDGSGGFPDPNTVSNENRYPVGIEPRALAADDLDGQSGADLVVANGGSDDLSVLLNNGDGTFAPEMRFAGGTHPQDVGIADFDNDGDSDVITGNDGSVTFHANDGAGMLAAPVALMDFGTSIVREVYLRDFNLDGNVDISVRFSSGREIEMLFGSGDGTIQRPPVLDSSGVDVAAADLDGDRTRDLLFARAGGGRTGEVAVRFNDGHGTFGPEVLVNTDDLQQTPETVIAEDVTGDGAPDAVLTDSAGFSSTGGLVAYPGNGDGTFDRQIITAGIGPAFGLAVGDLDGVGTLDAAVTWGLSTSGLSLAALSGNGDGSFSVVDEFQINDALPDSAVAIGDLDDDGHNDIVAVQRDAPAPVNILFNDGTGGFPGPLVRPAIDPDGNAEAKDVALFDIDGDDDRDILVTAVNAIGACADTISDALIILRNDSAANFAAPEIICGATRGDIELVDHEKAPGISIFLGQASDFGPENGFAVINRKGSGGLLVPQVTFRMPGIGDTQAILAEDIDRDGFAEVIGIGQGIAIADVFPPGVVFFDGYEGI